MNQINKKICRIFLAFLGIVSLLGMSGCTGQSTATTIKKWQTVLQESEKSQNRDVDGTMEVHFIDVGQGDATFIDAGGHAMLIDAGENNRGEEVCSYLKNEGVTELEYVVGTHPDSDHIGGLDDILYEMSCDEIIMPEVESDTKTYEEVVDAVDETSLEWIYPKVGEQYSLGEATFTIVAPNEDYGEDKNDWSVGILLQYGKNRFLFTGDAEEKSESDMLENGIDLSADVYKASHHGSKTGSSQKFLEAVHPSVAVISCGEDNEYGHPGASTLQHFRQDGIKVYRTDEQGTIVASSDGKSITWNTSPDESWKQGEQTGGSQYILNLRTKKYHRSNCSRVDTIAEKNRKTTTETKKQLEKEGYEPCGFCNP